MGAVETGDRKGGESAVPRDFRHHPLRNFAESLRARQNGQVGVTVHVDEAGRKDAPPQVERAIGGGSGDRRLNCADFGAFGQDRALAQRSAGAVGEPQIFIKNA